MMLTRKNAINKSMVDETIMSKIKSCKFFREIISAGINCSLENKIIPIESLFDAKVMILFH